MIELGNAQKYFDHQLQIEASGLKPDVERSYVSYTKEPSDIVEIEDELFFSISKAVSNTVYQGGGPGYCWLKLYSETSLKNSGILIPEFEKWRNGGFEKVLEN